jgi:hypothetical protein
MLQSDSRYVYDATDRETLLMCRVTIMVTEALTVIPEFYSPLTTVRKPEQLVLIPTMSCTDPVRDCHEYIGLLFPHSIIQ